MARPKITLEQALQQVMTESKQTSEKTAAKQENSLTSDMRKLASELKKMASEPITYDDLNRVKVSFYGK